MSEGTVLAPPAGATGAPAGATGSPGATGATGATGAPGPGADDWMSGYAPEVRDAVKLKGYKSHADVAMGWHAASKLVGVDPNNVIKFPGKDADEATTRAAFDAIYARLGRPEKADGYALPDALKDDPIAAEFRNTAHAAGLSAKQAEALLGWYTGVGTKSQEAVAQRESAAQDKRYTALQAEIGPEKWPAYLEDARRATRVLLPETYKDPATGQELTRDQIAAKLEGALGRDLAVRVLNQAAQFTREDSTMAGVATGAKMDGPAAQARKDALKKDKAWVAKWTAGDAEARKEMTNLDVIIHAWKQQQGMT